MSATCFRTSPNAWYAARSSYGRHRPQNERPPGRPVCLLADDDATGRRATLQPRRGVDHVPGRERVTGVVAGADRDHGLARVDRGPDREIEPRMRPVELLDR